MANYWSTVQDQLFEDYLTTSGRTKNRIYNELRPSLLIMFESILKRYFNNFLHLIKKAGLELIDALTECEYHLVSFALDKFQIGKGKPYSFIGTCARHFFYNFFERIGGSKNQSLYDIDNGLVVDQVEEVEEEQEDLLLLANKKLDSLIDLHSTGEESKESLLIFQLIKKYINENKMISKFKVTNYLLENTGFKLSRIKAIIYENKMKNIIGICERVNKYHIQKSNKILYKFVANETDNTDSLYNRNKYERTKKRRKTNSGY